MSIFGGIGSFAGALLGAYIGGVPGALALGQLGSTVGFQIGKRSATDRILTIAERYFFSAAFSGGTAALSYWAGNKMMQDRCRATHEYLPCAVIDWVNVGVITTSAAGWMYVATRSAMSPLRTQVAETTHQTLKELEIKCSDLIGWSFSLFRTKGS